MIDMNAKREKWGSTIEEKGGEEDREKDRTTPLQLYGHIIIVLKHMHYDPTRKRARETERQREIQQR